MAFPKGWMFDVLLDHVGVLFDEGGWSFTIILVVVTRCSCAVRVVHRCIVVFLKSQIFFKLLHLLAHTFIDLSPEMVQTLSQKYTSTLSTGFWLGNEQYFRVSRTLFGGHQASFNFFLPNSTLALPEVLNIVEITWVEPRLGEEVIVIRELFLKPLQVDPQSVLSGNVVHPKEMVHTLMRCHGRQLFDTYSKILPCYIPLHLFIILWFEFVEGKLLRNSCFATLFDLNIIWLLKRRCSLPSSFKGRFSFNFLLNNQRSFLFNFFPLSG